MSFGARQVGSRSSVRTLTVSNTGDGRLVLQSVSLAGPAAGDFRIVPGTCEGASFIAPRSSCTIGVGFNPTATGSRSATLRIRHNAGGIRSGNTGKPARFGYRSTFTGPGSGPGITSF